MNVDFFEKIDTKEKAYWLGFLYADGYVRKYRLVVKISIKDEALLYNLMKSLDVDPVIHHYSCEPNKSTVYIYSKKISDDLNLHGCVQRKSKTIELPEFDSHDLYLAFLLGFFDGDGCEGKTLITCGSRRFLEQIKERSNLSFGIREKTGGRFIEGTRLVQGKAYDMYLGTGLFNEMMENYMDSLPRKRKHFCTKDEKSKRAGEASHSFNGKSKMSITRDVLERIVWEKPTCEIAKDFGVSDKAISGRCQRLNIQKPGRGYWAKVRSNDKSQ
jgi:hypothetical protein